MEQAYNGHVIRVTDDLRFEVAGPQFGAEDGRFDRTFDSRRGAAEEIDRRIQAARKQGQTRTSLPVVDGHGERRTITGIHADTGRALGIVHDRYNSAVVYPDVPWIVALVAERNNARVYLQTLNGKLNRYEIETNLGHGRVSPERCDGLVQQLTADHRSQTEAALRDAPKTGKTSP